MSVHVEITVAGGATRRHLEINRISNLTHIGPAKDLNLTSRYEVILTGGAPSTDARATFEHRYGDDVLTLISKASEALEFDSNGRRPQN